MNLNPNTSSQMLNCINHIRKRRLVTCFILLLSMQAISQETKRSNPAARDTFTKIFDYDSSTWLLIFLFFIMAFTIFVLYSSLKTVLRHYLPFEFKEEKLSQEKNSPKIKESAWTIFDRKFLTRAVPVEREADVMLDHNYDGIRELDNSLPPWWKWGFIVTIIFAVVYLMSYEVAGTGKSSLEEYQEELAFAEKAKSVRMKLSGENINEESVIVLKDAASLNEGKNIYQKNCVACHLADGGGQVGPNFTDEYWIHGGGIRNLFITITDGVPEKGMISWKTQLTPKQIQEVGSYILTFQGTKPLVAKEPQGDKWIDAVIPPTDTSAVASADSSAKK